ncbi:Minor extracellular protease vpr [Apiospora arundinis]
MRLLNTNTTQDLSLQEFDANKTPTYAILSHTWTDEEFLFYDIHNGTGQSKKGFSKVVDCCAKVAEQSFEWVWIDTCCIDKSSSAELTEAINSMFQWYQSSKVCYVFLNDLRPGDAMDYVRYCRWVKRGWTLQELIAPAKVEFYDSDWNYRGSKMEYSTLLGEVTGIPIPLLLGSCELHTYSVASRMSWAAQRMTTRPEDIAYWLLGIFDISTPPIYGEGSKAFRRLQEEIVRRNNAMTIFAWSQVPSEAPLFQQSLAGVFAESPASFYDSGAIYPFRDDFDSISVTNRGLLLSGDIPIRVVLSMSLSSKVEQYMNGNFERRDIGNLEFMFLTILH